MDYLQNFSLEGKVALITGASYGIGFAIAKAMAGAGATIVFNAIKTDGRTEARLIELACGPVPEGHSRWTIRLLEEESKVILETPVGREAIRKALKKTNFDLTKTTTGAFQQKKTQNS